MRNKVETIEYKPAITRLFNLLIVILAFILILVIHLPANIWKEEKRMREIGRSRMSTIYEVQKYCKQMLGEYQKDPILAMKLISAIRDSTVSDSNFYGEQKLRLSESVFKVGVIKDFYKLFDTTFAIAYQKTDTIVDTSYKVVVWNEEVLAFDTVFIHSSRIRTVMSDPLFRALLDTEYTSRLSTQTYYRPYKLDSIIAYRPLTNEHYEILIDNDHIRIQDPLKGVYKEPRYLVFAFKDTSHGWIENGQKSWEEK